MLCIYSLGHNRTDAAAGPAGVQAEEGDTLHTAAPAPEDNWGTVQEHFEKALEWRKKKKKNSKMSPYKCNKASEAVVRCGHVYEQREGAGKGWQGLESNEAHVALLCAHNAFHHRALARGDLQERAFARVPQGIHLVAFASLLAHYWHELGFRQRMSDGKFQQRKKKRKKKQTQEPKEVRVLYMSRKSNFSPKHSTLH